MVVTGYNINSYPDIYAVGHRAADDLFSGPVLVEEKIDGSQFSFGIIGGKLQIRSKGASIDVNDPPKMFSKQVEYVYGLYMDGLLESEVTYRGEALSKPKHNTLAYDRVPENNIIIFDIVKYGENYFTPETKRIEAARIGLETVPVLFEGQVTSDMLAELVSAMPSVLSVLGGQMIEGMVFKNYAIFGPDKKILIGKLVSKEFQETHQTEWKVKNPNREDIVISLGRVLNTEARFRKAVQHLRDNDTLLDEPKDIGPLMRELNLDILKEESDFIKETLFKHFQKDIMSRATRGFPEFYKELLLENALQKQRGSEEED